MKDNEKQTFIRNFVGLFGLMMEKDGDNTCNEKST